MSVRIGKSKRLSEAGKTVTGRVVGPGSYSQISLFNKQIPGVTAFSKVPDTRNKNFVDPLLRQRYANPGPGQYTSELNIESGAVAFVSLDNSSGSGSK